VSGFGCQPFKVPNASFLYETARGWNSELIERGTSNVQHRTSNIDDATLYLFNKSQPNSATRLANSIFERWIRSRTAHVAQPPDAAGAYTLRVVQYFSKLTEFNIQYSMFDVQCSSIKLAALKYDLRRPTAGLTPET
jgi:hypothetical protein